MKHGSITVYLSMSLLLAIGLIVTVLESARIQGLKAQMIMGAESALDSVFAEYDKTMFEKYGITLFDGGTDGIQIKETMLDYFSQEYSGTANEIFAGFTWYPLTAEDVYPQKIIRAVDAKGSIFAHLVTEFMKYNAVGDQAERILEQLNILEKGEDARNDAEDAKEEAIRTDWGMQGETNVSRKTDIPVKHMAQVILENTEIEDNTGEEENKFDQERYEKEWEDSMVSDVEEIKAGGFLKLVLPRGSALSGEAIETEDLPSGQIPEGEPLTFQNGLDDLGREVLYNVYLTEYFPSFVTEEKRNGPQYELEYILFGKDSDEANLKAAVNRLLLIREGLNILHILQSPEKMEAVLAMATAIMGWTLIPAIVTLTQAALVGAWAYGESIMDVRTLLGGGKISLIKNQEEWNLSLQGVADLLKGTIAEGKEGENGLTYTDYLMLLLFLEDKEEKYYRTMDMVQVNMRKTNPDFLMRECIFGVQVGISVKAGKMFPQWTWLSGGSGGRPYEYAYSVSRMY